MHLSRYQIIDLTGSSRPPNQSRSIALGMFDGVHLGHQALLRANRQQARAKNLLAVATTFREAPFRQLFPDRKIELITSLDERLELFRDLGLDQVLVWDFAQIRSLSAQEYLELLAGELKVKALICSSNHTFGLSGHGDTGLIAAQAEALGFDFQVQDLVTLEGQRVSSSAVREAIKACDLERVAGLLGRLYTHTGPVQTGAGRGRTIGFPTINQAFPHDKARLPLGVYRTTAQIGGQSYPSVTNFGFAPTFGEKSEVVMETHLLGVKIEVLPENTQVCLQFHNFLRPERKFASVQALTEQIEEDCRVSLGLHIQA